MIVSTTAYTVYMLLLNMTKLGNALQLSHPPLGGVGVKLNLYPQIILVPCCSFMANMMSSSESSFHLFD